LFHLVFESHSGRALAPIPKRSTSAKIAERMISFNPDRTWQTVSDTAQCSNLLTLFAATHKLPPARVLIRFFPPGVVRGKSVRYESHLLELHQCQSWRIC
jgi:hypothetical protein